MKKSSSKIPKTKGGKKKQKYATLEEDVCIEWSRGDEVLPSGETTPAATDVEMKKEEEMDEMEKEEEEVVSIPELGRGVRSRDQASRLGRSRNRNCQRRRNATVSASPQRGSSASPEESTTTTANNRIGSHRHRRRLRREQGDNRHDTSKKRDRSASVKPGGRVRRTKSNDDSLLPAGGRIRRTRSHDGSVVPPPPLLSIGDLYSGGKKPTTTEQAARSPRRPVQRTRSRDSIHWNLKERKKTQLKQLEGSTSSRTPILSSSSPQQSFWVCSACECKDNALPFNFCVGCGKPREEMNEKHTTTSSRIAAVAA